MMSHIRREMDSLIQLIDSEEAQGPKSKRRRNERSPFVVNNLHLEIKSGVESEREIIVSSRNLSTGGIGVISDHFLYENTRVVVKLMTGNGSWRSVPGRVVRCRYVANSRHYYDVGIEFAEPVQVSWFIQRSRPRRVLLIDDSPTIGLMVERVLGSVQIECQCVHSAREGLKLLESTPFDAAMIEIHMAEMSGVDCIKALRHRGHPIPALAITAATEVTLPEMLTAGFDGLVKKPFGAAELSSALDAIWIPDLQSSMREDPEFTTAIREYVEQLALVRKDMGVAAEKGDQKEIHRLADRLLGEAAGFGFEAIAKSAQALLAAVATGNYLPQLVQTLRLCASAQAPAE